MNYSSLQTQVQNNLGRTDTTSTGYIQTAINYILTEDLPRRGLRPLLQIDTSLSTTSGQEYVDLSSLTGFVGFEESGATIEDGDDWDNLTPMLVDKLKITDSGKPTHFMVLFSSGVPRLYLRDIPDSAYDLKLFYYAQETALSSDSDEANLSKTYGDMPIIAGATMEVALKLENVNLYALWRQRYLQEVLKVMQWQYDLEGESKFMYNLYV